MQKGDWVRIINPEALHYGKVGCIRHPIGHGTGTPPRNFVVGFEGDQRIWPEPYHETVPYSVGELQLVSNPTGQPAG